jgi:hypothetical protein
MINGIPPLALSVRQPWAWAIIHGFKDIENRSPAAVRNLGAGAVGYRAIHASRGMTQEEYTDASEFMRSIGVMCPPPDALLRGGIIGAVRVDGVVNASDSKWFFGPRGLVLSDARTENFIPAVGALGYFKWKPADASVVPSPARWMRPVFVGVDLARGDDDQSPAQGALL